MIRTIVLAFGLAMSFSASADTRLPRDVEKFMVEREGCDHFRGEIPDPDQKARMKEVNREIAKLCKGTDRRLAKLKKKYASDLVVMQRLGEFETEIEAAK